MTNKNDDRIASFFFSDSSVTGTYWMVAYVLLMVLVLGTFFHLIW